MTQQESVKQNSANSRRTRRMNRRQQDILKVAARLFAERGYERTTLEMIANELDLSKPSLYYYVKSKEDVLAHIFQQIFQDMLDHVQTAFSQDMSPPERLHHLITAYVTHACIYPEGRILFLYESYLLSVCNPELLALRDHYQQQVEDVITAWAISLPPAAPPSGPRSMTQLELPTAISQKCESLGKCS